MKVFAYSYIGPEKIRQEADGAPSGAAVRRPADLEAWVLQNSEALTDAMTFIVDLDGYLRLAPRRSEHVACAGGSEVLSAGEVCFRRRADGGFAVTDVSNQSTGYCPDTSSWESMRCALRRIGVEPPRGFTRPIVFRRCENCREINLVKDGWLVCVFCESDLPAEWNVSRAREVELP